MQADKPKHCARCAVEVTPANWERLASGFLLCRACFLESERPSPAVLALRERNAHNPALAALREACSKGSPILERPTAQALEARGEEPETPVLFRRWPKSREGFGGDVLALFPMLPETRPGTCASYAHVGQHSAADLSGVVASTRPASLEDEDVRALRAELERIGYRLRPIKRAPHWRKLAEARRSAGL